MEEAALLSRSFETLFSLAILKMWPMKCKLKTSIKGHFNYFVTFLSSKERQAACVVSFILSAIFPKCPLWCFKYHLLQDSSSVCTAAAFLSQMYRQPPYPGFDLHNPSITKLANKLRKCPGKGTHCMFGECFCVVFSFRKTKHHHNFVYVKRLTEQLTNQN